MRRETRREEEAVDRRMVIRSRVAELFLHRGLKRVPNDTPMTFKLWILAGGLLAACAAAGTAIRMARARSKRVTFSDQLSSDWLSQARAREEHPW